MRYLVAGDVHANTRWFTNVVEPLAVELHADAIIAVGDFGYWGTVDGEFFIEHASNSSVPVYFCDGNHEDHLLLAADAEKARQQHGVVDPYQPVPLGGALWYLGRGSRLEADGVRIVAVGGAASIDRATRQVGISWFVEERITDLNAAVNLARWEYQPAATGPPPLPAAA